MERFCRNFLLWYSSAADTVLNCRHFFLVKNENLLSYFLVLFRHISWCRTRSLKMIASICCRWFCFYEFRRKKYHVFKQSQVIAVLVSWQRLVSSSKLFHSLISSANIQETFSIFPGVLSSYIQRWKFIGQKSFPIFTSVTTSYIPRWEFIGWFCDFLGTKSFQLLFGIDRCTIFFTMK